MHPELLKNLYFSSFRPTYINYGTLMTVFGHELEHSLDFSSKYINESNIDDNAWSGLWNEQYHAGKISLIKQFKNIVNEEDKKKLHNQEILNEIFADNIGIRGAYLAYQDWARTHESELKIRFLTLNSNQSFWLTFTNRYCMSKLPAPMQDTLGDKRVVAVLSSISEFSNDLNCSLGSNMNSIKKVRLLD